MSAIKFKKPQFLKCFLALTTFIVLASVSTGELFAQTCGGTTSVAQENSECLPSGVGTFTCRRWATTDRPACINDIGGCGRWWVTRVYCDCTIPANQRSCSAWCNPVETNWYTAGCSVPNPTPTPTTLPPGETCTPSQTIPGDN